MKTTNRPTSTTRLQQSHDLATLEAIVRSLWAKEPQFHHEQRNEMVSELLEVETDLGRLLIRQASMTLRGEDAHEVFDCARQLRDLEQRWSAESAEPNVLAEAFP